MKEWPRMSRAVGLPAKMAKCLAVGLGIQGKTGRPGVLRSSERTSVEEPLWWLKCG